MEKNVSGILIYRKILISHVKSDVIVWSKRVLLYNSIWMCFSEEEFRATLVDMEQELILMREENLKLKSGGKLKQLHTN